MLVPEQIPLFDRDSAGLTLRGVADAVRSTGLEGLPDAKRRGDDVRYQDVMVRSALTHAQGMPFKWALNPYRGCTHACEYCYARKYQRHLELGAGDDFSSLIFVKRNVPDVLRREVSRRTWTHEGVAVGTATDPYQPIEGDARLTRRCLEALVESRTPFSIVTKGPMAVRDLDVLQGAASAAGCEVFFSVPSVDDEAWRRLEPGTAPPRQRIAAAARLARGGIDVGILMMPLIPGITTSAASLERTMIAAADAGVRIAGTCIARLDAGVREHFFSFLQREYPQLVDGYLRLYPRAYASRGYVERVKDVVREIRERVRKGREALKS